MGDIHGIVCVHFDEDGSQTYRVFGGDEVRLFIVDERAPNDRVYEWLPREPSEAFRDLVAAGEPIGSSQDERHEAVAHAIRAYDEGKPHLRLVQSDPA